ncbi:MAG: hypothetical protein PHS00_01680 [Candidatus Pacebacteria bacterium]|nr:hypothetical protein [Candidatus Paceibacterota bacterium]
MAIDFRNENNNKIFSSKLLIPAIVLIVGILVFIVFKTGVFSSQNEIIESAQMFQPIVIDFDFLKGEEFQALEKFSGIPVLSGFFSASDTEVDPEIIEPGRVNPFEIVSSSEIELAVVKVILRISTIEEIENMKTIINESSLYTSSEKKNLLSKLEEQRKTLEVVEEEIISPIEEDVPVVEEDVTSPKEVDYYKEW